MTGTDSPQSIALQNELKTKQICRFCLTQQLDKLGSIYQRDVRLKSSAPLPVQVMACASIEVFTNDGMPSKVCSDCRLLFEHAYRFKQMCKRADTLLRQFPLVGQWPIPLAKPKFPKELVPVKTTAMVTPPKQQSIVTIPSNQSLTKSLSPIANKAKKASENAPPKILNAYPVNSPEPPMPTRMKKEKLDEETTLFLNKVENNEELSMDDVQRLIAAADKDKVEFVEDQNESDSALTISMPPPSTPRSKPKLLNKSSIRILNRDAEIVLEPRLSAPQLKRDVDGNMAMVTEILDPLAPYEPEQDPAKNASPLETVVFPCPHCERSFPLRQLRDIHMVNHTRNRSFQCPDCEKSFFSKYDLQKHSLIHTGDRPFKCTVCEKSFTRANLLHRHEKSHTDIPKFICIHCEKPFISKEQMEKHSERHLKNRPYQCSVCSKSFAFKQGLERHEVVHSREQPYPCQYCEQSFSTPSKLARHLTAHAGKRPYPCKFCPKAYLLSHHLTRHLRSHKNGTFTFLCSDCEKVFNSRDELIYHSAVHATQTLVCPLCKDTFQDIQSVTVHIKEHAEGDAFACEFCDLIYMTAERLQKHTDEDHIGDMAAYREDDALNATEKIDKERSKSIENVGITEETIEEFLFDELPDCEKYSRNEIIKTEEPWADQPKIINEIVFKTKLNASDEENLMLLDESNIIVANEADVIEYAFPEQQPPVKTRKAVAPDSQTIIKTVERSKWPQSNTSPALRRKAPQAIDIPAPKSKIEKQIIATSSAANCSINSVLKMLPKGVSVRRNPSNNEKISPQPQQQHTKTEDRGVANKVILHSTTPHSRPQSVLNKSSPPNTNAPSSDARNCQSTNKKSPGTTQSSADTKTVKMMLGNKKVKVQKITITKAEAAAMAKDGRIRMKDGAMVLTKAVK